MNYKKLLLNALITSVAATAIYALLCSLQRDHVGLDILVYFFIFLALDFLLKFFEEKRNRKKYPRLSEKDEQEIDKVL